MTRETNDRPAVLAGRNVRPGTRYPMLGEFKYEYRHGPGAPRMLKYKVRNVDIDIPASMVVHQGEKAPAQIWIDVYVEPVRRPHLKRPCLACKETETFEIDSSSVCLRS